MIPKPLQFLLLVPLAFGPIAPRFFVGLFLLALVGLDVASHFAPWYTQRLVALLLVALVVVLLVSSSWLVFASWRHRVVFYSGSPT